MQLWFAVFAHGFRALVEGVIMASLLAVQPVMMQGRNSFELYGYDVILDESLTPWLLEVNASPSLSATDTEDYRLKFDLIDDVLNIIDFEHRFTTNQTRIGGFDLIWYNDSPIWITLPTHHSSYFCEEKSCNGFQKLNIFLGAKNNRIEQLNKIMRIC
ncbi:probable tubulin polyglutamylase TTLL9 [Polistes fuscatus]|uniref:probable tubulin polyglutamylase TTLL9 n=1 Tax=Polistes fuscatus TaxID=30207 RepID=UPI001CAA34AD|nr:probable tubulin polyglutamylase TTLL9 [Polistes fuscatus]